MDAKLPFCFHIFTKNIELFFSKQYHLLDMEIMMRTDVNVPLIFYNENTQMKFSFPLKLINLIHVIESYK